MTTDSARDKLVDEFSSVLSEAETLLDKASKEWRKLIPHGQVPKRSKPAGS